MLTKCSNGSKTYEYVFSGDKLVQMTITKHTTSPETVQLVELSYDAAGQPLTITLDGVIYYYVLNIQGDVMGLVDENGSLQFGVNYNGYGSAFYYAGVSSMNGTLSVANPLRYRGYTWDIGTGLYYLQSRYYDPEIGRFINEDIFVSTGQGVSNKNMFVYCLNNPIMGIDIDGYRTYFLNGIHNEDEEDAPDYAITFADALQKASGEIVHPIPIYNGQRKIIDYGVGAIQVMREMFNINVYSDYVFEYIVNDLAENPLAEGETINIIGYSGGGQVALNVMEMLQEAGYAVDNVILIAAPVNEIMYTTTQISYLYSIVDPFSWVYGYGVDFYYMGAVGHTRYFSGKNLEKTVAVVDKLILR